MTNYYIVCEETKLKAWIGQQGAGSSMPWLYENNQLLTDFLVQHENRPIRFVSEYWLEINDPDFVYSCFDNASGASIRPKESEHSAKETGTESDGDTGLTSRLMINTVDEFRRFLAGAFRLAV